MKNFNKLFYFFMGFWIKVEVKCLFDMFLRKLCSYFWVSLFLCYVIVLERMGEIVICLYKIIVFEVLKIVWDKVSIIFKIY